MYVCINSSTLKQNSAPRDSSGMTCTVTSGIPNLGYIFCPIRFVNHELAAMFGYLFLTNHMKLQIFELSDFKMY